MHKETFHDVFDVEGDYLERAGFQRPPETDTLAEEEFEEWAASKIAPMEIPNVSTSNEESFTADVLELGQTIPTAMPLEQNQQ